MLVGVDHIVILVSDLEVAISDYTALGFTVVPGGEHSDGSTHNALIAFGDGTYLELIAFKKPSPEHRWWRFQAMGEGLIDYALLPNALNLDIEQARARGLEIEGPFPGGRLRPDGQELKWQTALPTTPDLPFLCADVTPRNLRVPGQEFQNHANGVTGIAYVHVVVSDFARSVDRYRALLGVAPQMPDALISVDENRIAGFAINPNSMVNTLVLSEAKAASNLEQLLQVRGEGVFQLTLRVLPSKLKSVNFDASLAHGARLDYVS